jgi:predicted dinucleotide-binding enzyme
MKIAIIGAGRVGRALGSRWQSVGHHVVYGVRDPNDAKVTDLSATATVVDSVREAEAVLIALPWAAVEETISTLSIGDAVVMDATNPLAANARELVADPAMSGAELVRQWCGSNRVVKAFNTTGSGNMVDNNYPSGKVLMPVTGDDQTAKAVAIGLAGDLGFEGIDAGPLAASRDLEHVAMLWIRLAYPLGNGPNIAFGLMRR